MYMQSQSRHFHYPQHHKQHKPSKHTTNLVNHSLKLGPDLTLYQLHLSIDTNIVVDIHMVKPGKSSPLSSPSEQPTSDQTEPKYKGVRKRKWGKWVSEIRLPNSRERIWLGSYDTPEKAARAFDAALYCLRGGDAKFNFPGNPPDIADRQSLNPQEIQAVAARYANEEPATDGSGLEAHSSRGVLEHCTTSTSSSDGALQVDGDAALDWSFLNMLDTNNGVSEFGLYPWQDSMSGDYNYQPTDGEAGSSSQVVDENNREGDHTNDIHEGYSQSSFLWNF